MTNLRVIRLPRAREDLVEIAVYLSERGADLSERFLDSVEEIFEEVRRMPGLGARAETNNPRLAGLRCRQVPGFPRYLVFYLALATDDELQVVRVLHGARDTRSILEAEGQDEG